MKYWNVVFEGGHACGRFAEDQDELIAILAEEFPGRKILSIVEAFNHFEEKEEPECSTN